MPVKVLHSEGDLELDTSGHVAQTTIAGPVGSTACAAGGAVYRLGGGGYWEPDSRSVRVALNGNAATLSVGVDRGSSTCVRDAWLSYWED